MHLFDRLTFGACVALALLVTASPARAEVCGAPMTTPLIAGQHYTSGSIILANDADHLYVQYATVEPWLISEAHAAVASTLAGIPQSRAGNPIPGRFSYSATFDPELSTYTFAIPIAGLFAEGSTVFVAAHAVVQAPREAGGSQTAWGYGPDFPGNNWAMYLQYTLQSCDGGGNS
ncbi:MAG: hypothetical protein AB7O32_09275 [Vicinamibacterales bacterium]